MYLKTIDEKYMHTIKHKHNSRDSSKSNGYSPLKLYRKLKVDCSAVGYYSYTQRWAKLKNKHPIALLKHTKKTNLSYQY